MANRQKVIWYEGMCLDPHHFQQWDRHHRFLLDFSLRSVAPYAWGVSELSIDKEALANGQFTLWRCRGIMPDGLAFNIPEDDPAPLSRSVKEVFRPTESRLLACLTIPLERDRGRNCRLEEETDARESRFFLKNIAVLDDNTGADERAVGVGQGNFQIRFGAESMEDLCVLKIAEIVRAADGSFVLSDRFIPPCLALEGSNILMAMIRRLVELLVARTSALSSSLSGFLAGESAPQDLRFFLALKTLNTYVPVINHFFSVAKIHPEDLYRKLLELAGQLTTFLPEGGVQTRNFPLYDHDNLSECFSQLDLQIRMALDSLVPSAKFTKIPLERRGESLYVSRSIDAGLLQKAKFYLIVSGDLPERKMIDEIPNNFRVASPDIMTMILSSFQKALPLKFVSSPPPGIPKKENACFFQMDSAGPFWEAIVRSNALAVFVPKEWTPLTVEVIAV
jgi:type VI secretion system protein ImpJ